MQSGESFRGETTQLGVVIRGETRRFPAIPAGTKILKTILGGPAVQCT